jgi:hypothetical protein
MYHRQPIYVLTFSRPAVFLFQLIFRVLSFGTLTSFEGALGYFETFCVFAAFAVELTFDRFCLSVYFLLTCSAIDLPTVD